MVDIDLDDMFSLSATADPYSYFGYLRELSPVYWNKRYQVWVVTRYDDVTYVLRHPEIFSSAFWKKDPIGAFPPIRPEDEDHYHFATNVISKFTNQLDSPDHMRIRKAIHSYFSPNAVERWRPLVKDVIKNLLSEIKNKKKVDLMTDFATPLPVMIISRFLGISEKDRDTIHWFSKQLRFIARTDEDRMKSLATGIRDLSSEIEKEVNYREKKKTDDLLSMMVRAHEEGIYSRDEVIANAMFILFAGHETTINLICNGVLAFIRHAEEWERLKQDGKMVYSATEECLRYEAPVKRVQRLTTADVVLGGQLLKKRQRVFAVISSANRDPRKFYKPDMFNISRHPNPHIAFGGGVHHCLGVSLARMEGQECFMALSNQVQSMDVQTQTLQYQPSFNVRSLKSLPINWS